MDFDFTEDQLSLRDAVARWVEKDFAFERRHALAKKGGATRAVYRELVDLGLAGLVVAGAAIASSTAPGFSGATSTPSSERSVWRRSRGWPSASASRSASV